MNRLMQAVKYTTAEKWASLQQFINGDPQCLEKQHHHHTDKKLPRMARKDAMDVINKELTELQARCFRSGYSGRQVERFADCFVRAAARAERDRWIKVAVVVVVIVLTVLLLLQFNSPYCLAAAIGRAGLIKLLAVWDWTHIYDSQCLVSNPLYTARDALTMEDCQICEGVGSIEHVPSVDPDEAVAQWFGRDLPIIVDDGLKDWTDVSVTSLHDVAQMYESDEVMKSERGCGFSSNLRTKYGGDHRGLMKDTLSRNISHFFAHWENCHAAAAKAFRAVFKRPYFLSPAVETSSTNWVFVSSNYSGTLFKQVSVDHPLVMLLQVSGQTEVQVEAWSPCGQLCPVLTDTLRAGQVLVFTEFLWKGSYLPASDQDSFAIGLGASF